jgi:hypothetical protein
MTTEYKLQLNSTLRNIEGNQDELNDTSIIFIMNMLLDLKDARTYVKVIDPLSIYLFVDQERLNRANRNRSKRDTYSRNPIAKIVDAQDLEDYELIVIPVHSGTLDTLKDGSPLNKTQHWSLLAYFTKLNIILHYDSCRGSNNEHAALLVSLLSRYAHNFIRDDTEVYTPDFMPTQDSFWQCGYVVILTVSEIISKKKANKLKEVVPLTE